MLYLIDQRDAEPEMSLALYRAALGWAVLRGTRFVIHIQRAVYEDPKEVARFSALGDVTKVSSDLPPDLFGRFAAKLFRSGSDIIQVEGIPSAALANELTRTAAPAKAVSGDLSPVEDVLIFEGDRALFASYDYGRDLILDLTDEELKTLRQTLLEAGLEVERVIPAPPAITSSS
jgi:hypothetical protein